MISICAYGSEPFDRLTPLADSALTLAREDDDKERALSQLQRFYVMSNNWLDTDNTTSTMLMAQVINEIGTLRYKLRDDNQEDLLHELLIRSVLETVTSDDYRFESMQNPYPESVNTLDLSASNIPQYLGSVVDLMARKRYDECQSILLALYDHVWTKSCDTEFRYPVTNTFILYNMALGLSKNARTLIRQTKIHMELAGDFGLEYARMLMYSSNLEASIGLTVRSKIYAEVAGDLCREMSVSPDVVMADYYRVFDATPASADDLTDEPSESYQNDIEKFILLNDRYYCFLTDSEREQRWESLLPKWSKLKLSLLDDAGNVADTDACLNAFQYEKQIALRSYTATVSAIRNSGDAQLNDWLDYLLELNTKLPQLILSADIYKVKAEYERTYKNLIQHAASKSILDHLYACTSISDIKSSLRQDEAFVDFGIINDRYYAIVVPGNDTEATVIPLSLTAELNTFIEQCNSADSATRVAQLYATDFLCRTLWQPLAAPLSGATSIYYCPVGALHSIMPDAISVDGEYLGEDHTFHILTSWQSIGHVRRSDVYIPRHVANFYDIEYYADRRELITEARSYGSTREFYGIIDKDNPINTAFSISSAITPIRLSGIHGCLDKIEKGVARVDTFTGVHASEPAFKHLSGNFCGALNVATHAFSLPKDSKQREYPYLMQQSLQSVHCNPSTGSLYPMYRCGMLLSGAERVWCERNIISGIDDGVLNGQEISSLDLSGVELITLMACATGDGDIDEYEGVHGLRRALKMAGCGSMITTAWNIDSEAASVYLEIFYDILLAGHGVTAAHRAAQLEVMKRFDDPYYWAVFQLVD